MKTPALRPAALALLATLAAGNAAAATEPAATVQLEKKIDLLSQQIEAMKAELQQLKAQNQALSDQQQQTQQQVTQQQASADNGVKLWGYGEIYYDRPVHDTSATSADLARAVFGIGYNFDERTQFNSEFEIEHAVTSSSDPGEFEVEQFYVNHQFTDKMAGKAGLFLIPSGLINLSHEPTNFYGVHRNFVETLIIPSTWREGGVAVTGNTDAGLSWDVGLTTGVDLAKWTINPSEPPASANDLKDLAPLQASHQELAQASAQNLSQYLAVNYKGIPGFTAGASVFTGQSQFQKGLARNQRTTLWEAHTRWTPGQADLSAVYARGHISNTAEVNQLYPGAANPLPADFYGYYLQAAYNVWKRDSYRLAPFLRWERFNLGSRYDGVPMGFNANGQPTERVWTYGANFYLNPHVVLKADYQMFQQNSRFDRLDLGLGLNF
ncbi:MAG: porin [Nevskiaceae bacterium]|nr:MAG: porin [Nevskiaceae bacterium]